VRKLMLVGGLSAILLGASATSASATTWNGSCVFHGVGKFEIPYRLVPAYNSYEGRASGTCTGALNGRKYSGPGHVYIDGRMSEPMACELGLPRNVPVLVTFGSPKRVRSTRLRLNSELAPRSFGEQAVHFAGIYNGQGYGHMSFHTGIDQGRSCALGPGVAQADFDLDTHTLGAVFG
jgi:hypothetical protein